MDEIKNLERLAEAAKPWDHPEHGAVRNKTAIDAFRKVFTPELILRLCQLARGQEWVDVNERLPDAGRQVPAMV